MATLYKAPRGTKDILPEEYYVWRKINKTAVEVSEKFGFKQINTPTFENIDLFSRSVGGSTDIVQKEMFSFIDNGGRTLALRPEGTSPVVRSVLEHGLLNMPLPLKIFYIVNCFRNERPQSGRYKEFYQFGVEIFGASSSYSEVELISVAKHFFDNLQILDLELIINSIGCNECRAKFKEKLTNYFESKKQILCDFCKNRLYTNPLRILDCKNLKCNEISKGAPIILENICKDCKEHFEAVCKLLTVANINYTINPNIVRGLDYYTRTVFEFKTKKLGAQDAVCGGGRYDDLIESLGGKKTPALGFGIGLNRVALLLNLEQKNESSCDLYISYIGEQSLYKAVAIATKLRSKDVKVEIDLLNRSPKAAMRYANKIGAKYSIVIGDQELMGKKLMVKNMDEDETLELKIENFEAEFIKILHLNSNSCK